MKNFTLLGPILWMVMLVILLLYDLTLLNGEGGIFIHTKTLDKLDVEASINVHKGKVIPDYVLSITISFKTEVHNNSTDSDVVPLLRFIIFVELPYLVDENAREDPQILVNVRDDDGPISHRIKDALMERPLSMFEKAKDELE